MNQKDLKIIASLRSDARMSLTKMSRKTHIPVSTIFDKLKSDEGNLIVKHTSILDFAKLGYHARANITLKVKREDKDSIKEFLIRNQAVNSLYRINNGYDFMIEGVFKQVNDMENFIDKLQEKFSIDDIKSFFIIEDLKKEAFLSDPELILLE